MFMTRIPALIAATVFAGALNAATVTETINLSGSAGLASSHTISAGDLSVTLTGHAVSATGDLIQDRDVGLWSTGAGVRKAHSGDDHRVDGYAADEMMLFAFNKTVTLTSIVFSYADRNDKFDLATYVADLTGAVSAHAYTTGLTITKLSKSGRRWNGGSGDKGIATLGAGDQITSAIFGIGASNDHTEFKIHSVTVDYDDTPPPAPAPVPLPAGGMLLMAGIGAFGVARRRKSKL